MKAHAGSKDEALWALEAHLPRLSTGIAIDIPDHFALRSLTINPIFLDQTSRATRILRQIVDTVVRARMLAGLEYEEPPQVWIEAQIESRQDTPIELPELRILVSSTFEYSTALRREWLRRELSRSLTIVSQVAIGQSRSALEAAYGYGSSEVTEDEHYSRSNARFTAIRRPLYTRPPQTRAEMNSTAVCYFAAPACVGVSEVETSLCIHLRALPIDRAGGYPVNAPIALKTGESVAFWFPLIYPKKLALLTQDERRFFSLSVGWRNSADSPPVEILSFPRISSRFRVLGHNPAYRFLPVLPNDPALWRSRHTTTFGLEAERIAPTELTGCSKVAVLLELEDGMDKDQIQTQQLWSTNIVAISVGIAAPSW